MRLLTFAAASVFGALAMGCGSSDGSEPSDGEPNPNPNPDPPGVPQELAFTAETDPITVESGGEILEACDSWSLGNTETLWLTRAVISSTLGVHHSDWMVLPDGLYPNPGNADVCRNFVDPERGGFSLFDGAVIGDVVFAQSTQAEHEEQAFGEGIAMAIPPNSQLIVYYHLINTTAEPADLNVTADLYTIPEDNVETQLKDIAGSEFRINVPAREESRFSVDCMFPDGLGGDFDVYFILPHYHYYGTGMRFEIIGGPDDGKVMFDTTGSVGEPLAAKVDPNSASLAGAEGMRFACDFNNATDQNIPWGAGANDEMCFFLMHTNSEYSWAAMSGFSFGGPQTDMGINPEGKHEFRSTGCTMLATDLLNEAP